MKKHKPPTEDQIEAEIKAQVRMVKEMDEIDNATPEELDAMIESIPVHNPPDPLEPFGCPCCRCEPCICTPLSMLQKRRDQEESTLYDNMLSLDGPI